MRDVDLCLCRQAGRGGIDGKRLLGTVDHFWLYLELLLVCGMVVMDELRPARLRERLRLTFLS